MIIRTTSVNTLFPAASYCEGILLRGFAETVPVCVIVVAFMGGPAVALVSRAGYA